MVGKTFHYREIFLDDAAEPEFKNFIKRI